jgi:hypothetical protein
VRMSGRSDPFRHFWRRVSSGQVIAPRLKFIKRGVGINSLEAEAFQDLSGVLKERPHVGPYKVLDPVGGDARSAVGGAPTPGSARFEAQP